MSSYIFGYGTSMISWAALSTGHPQKMLMQLEAPNVSHIGPKGKIGMLKNQEIRNKTIKNRKRDIFLGPMVRILNTFSELEKTDNIVGIYYQ